MKKRMCSDIAASKNDHLQKPLFCEHNSSVHPKRKPYTVQMQKHLRLLQTWARVRRTEKGLHVLLLEIVFENCPTSRPQRLHKIKYGTLNCKEELMQQSGRYDPISPSIPNYTQGCHFLRQWNFSVSAFQVVFVPFFIEYGNVILVFSFPHYGLRSRSHHSIHKVVCVIIIHQILSKL